MRYVVFAASLTCLFISALALPSGRDVGNGGNGVYIGQQLYLLDLVEAGIEKTPSIDSGLVPEQDFVQRLSVKLAGVPGAPVELIAKKLTEIAGADQTLALVLMETIELYNWVAVDASLTNLSDADSLVQSDLVQLAIRSDQTIHLDRALWNKLDPMNQTALIFHEAVYSLMLPSGSPLFQNSPRAREITASFFAGPVSLVGLRKSVRADLPIGGGGTAREADGEIRVGAFNSFSLHFMNYQAQDGTPMGYVLVIEVDGEGDGAGE